MVPQRLRGQLPGQGKNNLLWVFDRAGVHHHAAEGRTEPTALAFEQIEQQRTNIRLSGTRDAVVAIIMAVAGVGRQPDQRGVGVERQKLAGLGDERDGDSLIARQEIPHHNVIPAQAGTPFLCLKTPTEVPLARK